VTKIIVRPIGGLGNQLFGYAAARRLALANDAELVVDTVSGFAHDHVYRRHYQLERFAIPCRHATPAERLEPLSRVRRYLLRALSRRRPFERRRYIQQEGVEFEPRLLSLRPAGTTYIEGYWQSERYFADVAPTIRADLTSTPPTDAQNLALAERMRGVPSVAVHVRFFEAPGQADLSNAPPDYYARALAAMEQLVPGAHYFVFSDRPEAALARLPVERERLTLVAHNHGDANAYADLWLMTQCRHFIIANSTFSWWGAWLAQHPDKRIVAPGFVTRQGSAWWGFDGLLPDSWIRL
jgi:hypothetical protein